MKRFKAELGYHRVNSIKDTVTHKTYEFVDSDHRNIKTLVRLLNDVIK